VTGGAAVPFDAVVAATVGPPLAILSDLFSSRTQRWLATGGLVVGVFLASLLIHLTGQMVRERYDPHGSLVEAAQAALIVGLATAATWSVLELWSAGAQLENLGNLFRPDAGTVVLSIATLFMFLAAWGASHLADRLMRVLVEESRSFSQHQRKVGENLAQIVLYLIAVVASLAVWGVDLGDVLLGAGFLSVVLGLAARQTLSSVLAGFILLFGRPFDVGDWVAIEDREGEVTDVSIVNTELRTFNDEYVTIPNDVMVSRSLVNRSRRGRLRIDVSVGVDYDDDPEYAREVASEAMRSLDREELLTRPAPEAVLTGFGDSAVVLELRFWIGEPTARRRWAAQSAVVAAVKSAFEREELTIPFPQRTVERRDADSGRSDSLAGRSSQRRDGDET